MATDQNIENKILASKIDTAYGWYMVDWHFSPHKFFFSLLHLFLTEEAAIFKTWIRLMRRIRRIHRIRRIW